MKQRRVKVPSKLALNTIDSMCPQFYSLMSDEKALFDLSDVSFVTPDALLLLVTSSKLCYEKTQQPTMWVNANSEIRSYMDRMRINSLPFIFLEHPPFFKKRQYGKSDALIEVSTITSDQEIGNAIMKTKGILKRWLPNGSYANLMDISTLFKETFENSIEHSGTEPSKGVCYYTLQKYARADHTTEIQIAVGDIGVGILGSQKRKYPDTKDDAEAIVQALQHGRSSRKDGGGMGFANMRDALGNLNGHLTIRSGKARVEYPHKKNLIQILRHGTSYPGTQIFFKCRA